MEITTQKDGTCKIFGTPEELSKFIHLNNCYILQQKEITQKDILDFINNN